MSPISIKPINIFNLQMKYGTLSNYAKKFIKPQIKSISFAFERFFWGADSELILKQEQKLQEIGFKKIGKNINEGLIISGEERDYHVFSSDDKYLNFDILKSDSSEVLHRFSLHAHNDEYAITTNYSDLNIEEEITKVLDFVEGKLFKAKKECAPAKISQPYIPQQTTADKITKLNQILHRTKKVNGIKNVGFISSKEEKLLEAINDKLRVTQELYKQISDGKIRYEIRSAYKNYLPQPVTNKLGFKDIGPNGESISLFHTTYKNNAHTAITIIDVKGKEQKFVISQDMKTVQKNLPSKFVKSENSEYRICLTPQYYTQKEVDKSNLHLYLSCLDKEMEQFIKYTQNRFEKKEEIKLIKSNYDVATMDKYKDLLNDIHSSFENYRTKMRKYLRKTNKSRKFKIENNISTKLTSIAVKFDNITAEGYDLRLSYPKVRNKNATQLLVMHDNKIENSFYIFNNKLLRFNIKDLNDKFYRYNQKLYYYDKKYLQNSNLHDYLLLIQKKLHELNRKLDAIREKQIENRIKYHIKTS